MSKDDLEAIPNHLFIIFAERRVLIGNQNQQGNSRLSRNTLFRPVRAAIHLLRFGGGRCRGAVFQLEPSVGPGNGELGVHCRRGSRGRCGLFSVQRSYAGTILWAWLKSEVIMAGKRVWKAENYYEEAMKREVKKH